MSSDDRAHMRIYYRYYRKKRVVFRVYLNLPTYLPYVQHECVGRKILADLPSQPTRIKSHYDNGEVIKPPLEAQD